jgi:hypothetical protein
MATTAVLGWGSLCYDWHGLSLVQPVRWRLTGPTLPIEFSRRSKGDRADLLTAVIDGRNGVDVPTRVSISSLGDLNAIREELRVREGRTHASWIGSIDRSNHQQGDITVDFAHRIHKWLVTTEHGAVVWTAIPPDFGDDAFTVAAAVSHLRDLNPSKQQDAREYIAWAPDEVETPLRRALRDSGLLEGARPRPIDIATVWQD